jgi:carbonic anhydrase/acetyltransferase-like protein (isoleucine patch superfamily)
VNEYSSIWFNTVVRGDINPVYIGQNSNIQDNCTVHVSTKYSTKIGDNTVVGHNAVIHACSIGNGVLVGMGTTILDGAIIGDHVVVGAGTLIPPGKVVEDYSVVIGNPYKVIRKYNKDDEKMI